MYFGVIKVIPHMLTYIKLTEKGGVYRKMVGERCEAGERWYVSCCQHTSSICANSLITCGCKTTPDALKVVVRVVTRKAAQVAPLFLRPFADTVKRCPLFQHYSYDETTAVGMRHIPGSPRSSKGNLTTSWTFAHFPGVFVGVPIRRIVAT